MRACVVCGMLMTVAMAAHGQQSILGTYAGEYFERIPENYPKLQSVSLHIASAKDGNLSGKYSITEFSCRGTYDIQGTYQGDKLILQTTGGPMRGCEQQITLTVQGNKLVGNTTAEAPLRPGIELQRR